MPAQLTSVKRKNFQYPRDSESMEYDIYNLKKKTDDGGQAFKTIVSNK